LVARVGSKAEEKERMLKIISVGRVSRVVMIIVAFVVKVEDGMRSESGWGKVKLASCRLEVGVPMFFPTSERAYVLKGSSLWFANYLSILWSVYQV
jgi:hypothetical protein